MIKLTKLNNEPFALNSSHIVSIEIIPESKITLVNKEFYIVKESLDEIIERIIEQKHKEINVNY